MPITLRAQGDTAADNQASMSLISLGTNIADPLKRLAHVKAASAAMKSTMGSLKSILPTDFPSLGVPWLLEAATALYGKAKVADRIPQVANVVISNVPGRRCRCTWPARACSPTTPRRSSCTAWRSTSRCRATTSRWTSA